MKRIFMLLMLLTGSTFSVNKAKASAETRPRDTREAIAFKAMSNAIPLGKQEVILGEFCCDEAKSVKTPEEAFISIENGVRNGQVTATYSGVEYTRTIDKFLMHTMIATSEFFVSESGDSEAKSIVENIKCMYNKYKDPNISDEELEKIIREMATLSNPNVYFGPVQSQVNAADSVSSANRSNPNNAAKHSPNEQKNDDPKLDEVVGETSSLAVQAANIEVASPAAPEEQKGVPIHDVTAVAATGVSAAKASSGVVSSRLVNPTLNDETGQSAGDETPVEYGLWVKGVTARAKQKEYKTSPQYKLMQNGGIIGFDFGKENYVFGIAYTFMQGKAKGQGIGTKDKIVSNIGTLYGMLRFDNNVFINGQVQYGISRLKKSINTGTIEHGKTKGVITGAKLELGYDYYNKMMDTHFIPSAGVSYDDVIVKGWATSTKTYDKTSAEKNSLITGLSVRRDFKVDAITLAPEVHVDFDYAMLNKHRQKLVIVSNSPTVVPAAKLARTAYQVGGSLKLAKNGAINITVGYDLGLSKKFRSHTSYVSAKMKF